MAKKDLTQVNTDRVYGTIAAATAEPEQEAQQTQEVQEAQETPKERKARKTYTEEEAAEFLRTGRTSGRKGLDQNRINMAFLSDIYEYIQIMSRVRGETMTAFVNHVLRQHMEEHRDVYDKAIEFRNSL